jgi:hypothetical protein
VHIERHAGVRADKGRGDRAFLAAVDRARADWARHRGARIGGMQPAQHTSFSQQQVGVLGDLKSRRIKLHTRNLYSEYFSSYEGAASKKARLRP